MPPISPQSSRGGLITAVVIFAILFVTATIFAFIFSARATRAELDYANFTKEAQDIYARGSLNTPDLDALRGARTTEGSGFSAGTVLLDVSLGQTRQLATLLGGTNVATATTNARQALDTAKARLKDANVPLGNNLSTAVTALTNAVVARDGQIAQLTADRDQNITQVTAAKEQQTALVAANTAAVEAARAEATAAAAAAQTYTGTKDEQVAQIEAERAAERTKAAADAEALRQQIAEREGVAKKAQQELEQIKQRLAGLRGNTTNAVVSQADGTIIRLPGNGIAYINLGAGDQIAPGLTFEVYDKAEGVPVPAAADSTALPQGKASIEVLRVGSTSSEARITRTTPGQQLTEGDLIANLVYDRNTRYTFHVFGNFDLDQNGVSTPGDANVIKQLVTQWGGRVGDQISVSTDFVVLGAEPVIPNFTEEERNDPVNQKKFEDATAAADAYAKVVERAGELNIPILNQNRFLYYIGYYDQARR